jgi:hypothetical protein
MAFVDFNSAGPSIAPRASYAVQLDRAAGLPDASLNALEWSVVAIARNDRLSSLRSPGGVSIALALVFGRRVSPSLADAKLEVLRRTAVLSWHYGYTIPSADLQAFLAAGYSLDHYELLLASISAARMKQGKRA